jgi:hypothetical protein
MWSPAVRTARQGLWRQEEATVNVTVLAASGLSAYPLIS